MADDKHKEMADFVEASIRKALDGFVSGESEHEKAIGVVNKVVEQYTEEARKLGARMSSVDVQSFHELSESQKARVLDYRERFSCGVYGCKVAEPHVQQLIQDMGHEGLDKWVYKIDFDAPEEVKDQLMSSVSKGDWDAYRDMLMHHPDSYQAVFDPGDPREVYHVNMQVVLPTPVDYIKTTISLEGSDDGLEGRAVQGENQQDS